MNDNELEFDFVTDIDFTTILDKDEAPPEKEEPVEEAVAEPSGDEPYIPRRGSRYAHAAWATGRRWSRRSLPADSWF